MANFLLKVLFQFIPASESSLYPHIRYRIKIRETFANFMGEKPHCFITISIWLIVKWNIFPIFTSHWLSLFDNFQYPSFAVVRFHCFVCIPYQGIQTFAIFLVNIFLVVASCLEQKQKEVCCWKPGSRSGLQQRSDSSFHCYKHSQQDRVWVVSTFISTHCNGW